jgi:hypothetical protein
MSFLFYCSPSHNLWKIYLIFFKKRKEGTPNDFTSGALSIIVPASSYGLKSWILHKDSFEYLPSYMILCLRYIHGSFNFKWMVKAMEIASNNYHLKSFTSFIYIYHNNNSCVVETTKQLGMKKINKFKFHKSQGH